MKRRVDWKRVDWERANWKIVVILIDALIALAVGLFSPGIGVANTIALIVIVDIVILLCQLYNLVNKSMTEIKNRADNEERLFNEMLKTWNISTIAMEEIACRGEQVLAVA